MTATDFLVCVLDGSGGTIEGRTLLQKRAFFVSILSGIALDLNYHAHYYGPYSATIDNAVAQFKALGFVEEVSHGFGLKSKGFEVRRFDYRLTKDGRRIAHLTRQQQPHHYTRIKKALSVIKEAGDPNYVELSIAAKAYFVLARKHKAMSRTEILKEAETLDWNIKPQSLASAVKFLEKVRLASTG
jgi:uncharacterized protein YwgA